MADTQKSPSEGLSEGEAMLAFSRSTIAMVLTDPRQPDNPIVYVNRAFERTTGYSAEYTVGRNCRFLQGRDTDPAEVGKLRGAIERGEEITVNLVNYRADGSTFVNHLSISPIRDSEGEITYFLGIQREDSAVNPRTLKSSIDDSIVELRHRVKNHLSMIVGLVRLQSRDVAQPATFGTLARRIESLQLLYEELSRPETAARSRVSLGAYLGRIVSAIAHLDGRAGVRVNTEIAAIYVDPETALRVGLILSEVLTNTFQHAFDGREEGLVDVRVARLRSGGVRLHVTDDGVGMAPDVEWPDPQSLGGRIVLGLVDGLDAKLDVLRSANGTVVNLDVPAAALEVTQARND